MAALGGTVNICANVRSLYATKKYVKPAAWCSPRLKHPPSIFTDTGIDRCESAPSTYQLTPANSS